MINKSKCGLLVFSSSFVLFTIGYSSWIISSTTSLSSKGEATYDDGQKIEPVAYIVGKESTLYTSIEKALDVAISGEIVTIIPPTDKNYNDETNKVVPNKVEYTIRRNCSIKEGVSFVIPTDKTNFSSVTDASTLTTYINSMKVDVADRGRGSNSSYARFATSNSNYYLRSTINIADGVTLTNNGTLLIGGYISGGNSSGGCIGQTSHSYSQILLGNSSKINQTNSNANTYCYGYISEKTKNNSSSINFDNGNLYIPLIIDDYKGFAFSWAMTNGAIDTNRCSPFNQLEVRNIDSIVNIKYGVSVYGNIDVYLSYSSQNINTVFDKTISLLGTADAFLIQMNNSTYSSLTYKFDKESLVSNIDFYGGFKMHNLAMKLSQSIVTVDLSSTNTYFPISYRMNINLLKAIDQTLATYDTTSQRLKVLTGGTLNIGTGSVLNGSEIVVYSAFYDGSLGNGKSSRNMYPSNTSYPLKEAGILKISNGGILSTTSLAGTVFGSSSSITYTNSTIDSKEARNYKGSGSISPAWTISDYLEINEELQVVPLTKLTDSVSLSVGINTFSNYNTFLPSFSIKANDSTIETTITKFQKVIFYDSLTNYSYEFINNVYQAYYGSKFYQKNSLVQYNESNSIMGVINSVESISNNNNGVNEFNVQSITLTCTTPLFNGNIPLYPGKNVTLSANVVDINKSYNKVLSRSSSDNNIATVDSDGVVTGVALGNVTISCECDNVVGTINLNVIVEPVIESIESIYIADANGKSSLVAAGTSKFGGDTTSEYNGQYSNGSSPVFSVKINPSTAPYSSIVWVFNASDVGRQYVNDKTQKTETITGSTSVTVHIVSGSGASDDKATLKCTVTDLDGKTFTSTFVINHKADVSVCILAETKITMFDGTYKNAIDVKQGDVAIAFNHFTGCFEPSIIIGNDHVNEKENFHDIIHLYFSDGSETNAVYEHGFFDLDLNKYVYFRNDDCHSFIGHRFFGIVSSKDFSTRIVKLKDVKITREYTKVCSPVTANHLNIVSDNMLSFAGGLAGLFNFFDYDKDTLKYNEVFMKKDIQKYGLLSYKDFEDFMPKEIYELLPCQYLAVSIGKGLITFDIFHSYYDKFCSQLMDNFK